MTKRIIILFFVLQLPLTTNLNAQLRSLRGLKPINLIDMPTANILSQRTLDQGVHKFFHITLRVYNQGGMIGDISVIPLLAEALKDPEVDIRRTAALALGKIRLKD